MVKKELGLYYCNHCKNIGRYAVIQKVTSANCHECRSNIQVYEALYFTRLMINKLASVTKELQSLKNQELEIIECDDDNEEQEFNPLSGIKLSQTDSLATEQQHRPLDTWFKQRNIQPVFDMSAVDMSGYYDEAAVKIGKNYKVFKDVLGKIIWSYRKSHVGLNIDLRKYSQKDAQLINMICREFYSHTLFSRYNYQKKDKTIHLKLQKALPIQQFLMGFWLEWFALNFLLLKMQNKKNIFLFSCARNIKVKFANQDIFEIDVACLINDNPPLVIECKTGEFRQDIDKFLSIQKRLQIPEKNFVILATDLTKSQANSLSSMYGLTFLSLDMFEDFLDKIFE